jgi:hypothetical protein
MKSHNPKSHNEIRLNIQRLIIVPKLRIKDLRFILIQLSIVLTQKSNILPTNHRDNANVSPFLKRTKVAWCVHMHHVFLIGIPFAILKVLKSFKSYKSLESSKSFKSPIKAIYQFLFLKNNRNRILGGNAF